MPNATVMLIEAAERYGLSQLHQLRGRVGRGEHESLCILFGDPKLPRLEAIAERARRLPAGRDRPGAARRGRACSARASTACPSSAWRACPRTPSCSSAPATAPTSLLERTRRSSRARARAAARGGGGPLRARARPDPGMSDHSARSWSESFAAYLRDGIDALLPYLARRCRCGRTTPSGPTRGVWHGHDDVRRRFPRAARVHEHRAGGRAASRNRGDRVLVLFVWNADGGGERRQCGAEARGRSTSSAGERAGAAALLPRHAIAPAQRVRERPRREGRRGRVQRPPAAAAAGAGTRPTADRVREALFSMLGDVTGARVLDLYAGSGALGIEALSRGAAAAVFVERDRQAAAVIERNLATLGAASGASSTGDALRLRCARGRACSTSCSSTRHMIPAPASPERSPSVSRRSSPTTHAS